MDDEFRELYEILEAKIKASGYPGEIDGETFYEQVAAETENMENGTYMFLVKQDETASFQGCVTIMDDDLDLHYVDFFVGAAKYHVDFDA